MIKLKRVRYVLENARRLKVNEIALMLWSIPDVQEEIVRLNTDGQLFEGVDALSKLLTDIGGEYALSTKMEKEASGFDPNKVNLFDTGEFYDSFRVQPTIRGFTIIADTIKADQDLRDRWGDAIIGLNEGSIKDLILYILGDLRKLAVRQILKR